MGTFYTDEQIQEAIAALERHTSGIWERMKKRELVADRLDEEHEIENTAIVRVLTIVLPTVAFVAQAEDKNKARANLSIDIGNAVRSAVAADRATRNNYRVNQSCSI